MEKGKPIINLSDKQRAQISIFIMDIIMVLEKVKVKSLKVFKVLLNIIKFIIITTLALGPFKILDMMISKYGIDMISLGIVAFVLILFGICFSFVLAFYVVRFIIVSKDNEKKKGFFEDFFTFNI